MGTLLFYEILITKKANRNHVFAKARLAKDFITALYSKIAGTKGSRVSRLLVGPIDHVEDFTVLLDDSIDDPSYADAIKNVATSSEVGNCLLKATNTKKST